MDHDHDTGHGSQDENSGSDGAPDAAQFREAARQAAARVRATIVETTERMKQPEEITPVDSEVFEIAAMQHARALRDHDPKPTEVPPDEDRKGIEETIADLDERLHLGARMLRAFAAQIERLENAARDATAAAESRLVEEAAQTSKATMDVVAADALWKKVENALQEMEDRLDRVTAIEASLAGFMDRAEQLANVAAEKMEPPMIEVEPLQRTARPVKPDTAGADSAGAASYGTLSVDPERLQRYQDRA